MKFFSHIRVGNERYPALTGIRALGAMAVFFAHLPFVLGFSVAINVMTFFFVLSGFLIIYLYYDNTDIVSGRLYNYFVNRFARIYPVYFLLVTIAIIYRHEFGAVYLVKNYTLAHSLFHDRSARAIEQSWTLTVEECFYLLAPLFILLIRRIHFIAALLFGVLLLSLAVWISRMNLLYLFLESTDFIFSTTFFGHFFEFLCGAYLALMILKKENTDKPIHSRFHFTLIGAVGCLIVMSIPVIWQLNHYASERVVYIIANNFVLPVAVAVLYAGLMTEKTILSFFLSARWLGWLGRTSYAFYLLHGLLIEAIATPFIRPLFGNNYNLYVIIVFIIAQLIAFLIFTGYEEPLNILIRKKISAKRTGKVSGMHTTG